MELCLCVYYHNAYTGLLYIITQVILAFWLVLAYDLLEDTRIDDDSARFKNLNQSQFFAKHSNQSVRIILYRHTVRSRQCYFHVCQSGEIWNEKAFFPHILIFYYIKQIDSVLPCVCSVTDQRWHQNVVRTPVTHLAAPCVPLFCSYHILTSSVIYYWTDARQHGIYFLNRQHKINT